VTAPTIGPPATHLLLETADVKVWLMDVAPGATYPHHYHDFDYVLFYTTDVLATVYNGPDDHTTLWNARFDHGHGAPAEGIWTYAQSIFYIPGTGFLSPGFVNIGTTPMVAPLVEIKRPRRADQEGVGYGRTDALVGLAPTGSVHMIENDRVRVWQTVLEPGQSDRSRSRLDAAVFVIDGGSLAVHEDGTRHAFTAADRSAHWRAAARERTIENIGTSRYRDLTVELK
jgi:hypothetical protein